MISIIAAHDNNRVIGYKGGIPWHLKPDLARFKELTTGHIVVMGRKTYESIGKALPKRINLVVSKSENFRPKDALVFQSLKDAMDYSKNWDGKLVTYIIGGEQIYKEALPLADLILITKVLGTSMGDAYFPEIPEDLFFKLRESEIMEDELGQKFQFITYNKKWIPVSPQSSS